MILELISWKTGDRWSKTHLTLTGTDTLCGRIAPLFFGRRFVKLFYPNEFSVDCKVCKSMYESDYEGFYNR
jgi:hypothetical protein